MADYNEVDQMEPVKLTPWEIFKEEIVMLKWKVLLFACFMTFGSYYIYDFPGAIGAGKHHSIESYFLDHGKKYNQEMNQSLYSVYSWPNTVLAVFGGLLIDKFLGLRKAMILFVMLVFTGACVFFVGVWAKQYPLLLVGRFVFGLGGESLSVAQSTIVARWFKNGRGMALAFGISISFSRVGSSFNFLLSPEFASNHGILFAVGAGAVACLFSACSVFVLVFLDKRGTDRGVVPPETKETSDPFKLTDITQMPVLFWIISAICVTIYCSIFPLIGIAKNFFEVKYGISGTEAARYVSIYQFVCAGGSPVCGGIVDGIGRFTYWMFASCVGFALCHLYLMSVNLKSPWLPMTLMGLIYSVLVSALWPALPYVVEPHLVGLGYGIMTAMQNTGLAIYPLITGAILDAHTTPPKLTENCTNWTKSDMENTSFPTYYKPGSLTNCTNGSAPLADLAGFRATEALFLVTAGVGAVFAVLLYVLDRRRSGILSANPIRRKEIEEEKKSLVATVQGDVEEGGNASNVDFS